MELRICIIGYYWCWFKWVYWFWLTWVYFTSICWFWLLSLILDQAAFVDLGWLNWSPFNCVLLISIEQGSFAAFEWSGFFCLLELALSIFIYSFISFLFAELELVGHGHWFWMKVSFISIELISSIWMRIDFADFKRISLIVIELRFLISNNLGFTNWATFIDFGQTVATRSGLMEVEEYQDTFFPVVIYDTEF